MKLFDRQNQRAALAHRFQLRPAIFFFPESPIRGERVLIGLSSLILGFVCFRSVAVGTGQKPLSVANLKTRAKVICCRKRRNSAADMKIEIGLASHIRPHALKVKMRSS
ncbi:MAG: hypothetical protein C0507_19085 [Cyanobacteria bacterium PR.3.49]|nr:hypothetical protein [Cyanobacteria bacterium PR.3.49]